MREQRRPFLSGSFLAAGCLFAVFAFARPFAGGAAADLQRTIANPEAVPVIIPNIDDDDGDGRPDFTAEAPDPVADEEWLRVRVEPGTVLPEGALFSVEVPVAWKDHLKVFWLDPAGRKARPVAGPRERALDPEGRRGVDLAVEASAFAGPGRPRDVEIGVRFETKDGALISRRTIACSIAPFEMASCLDPVEAVHVIRTKLTERFVADLAPLVEAAGSRLRAFADPALAEHDIWIQDAVEIGLATDGERTVRAALQGNRGMKLDELFARSFLGRDSGTVHQGAFRGKAAEWIDWFGNLEVSPPLEAGGRDFPRGRIYAGTQGVRAMHPEVAAFLEAQGVQGPILWLDTSWLIIGHVDETVSWVPSDVGRPFRMLVPSPRLALEILRKAEGAAPGGVLNRGTTRGDSGKDEFCDAPVAAVLGDRALLADQELVQTKIDQVRRTLQAELGIADGDIIEIPVLFSSWPGRFAGRYGALTPNMVNSLQVGKTLIVADPHGPLVDGRDVLLQAVKDRLEPLGCRVAAVDNFFPYHRFGGEVHCGTNATRLRPNRPRGGLGAGDVR